MEKKAAVVEEEEEEAVDFDLFGQPPNQPARLARPARPGQPGQPGQQVANRRSAGQLSPLAGYQAEAPTSSRRSSQPSARITAVAESPNARIKRGARVCTGPVLYSVADTI